METSTLSPPEKTAPRKRMDVSSFFGLLVETGKAWSDHRVPKMGAALSYYTAFSLAPLVVFILSIVSLVVQKDSARQAIVNEANNLIGHKGGAAVQDILTHASYSAADVNEANTITSPVKPGGIVVGENYRPPPTSWRIPMAVHRKPHHSETFWGTVISLVILLVGASGAFGELQDSLNQIWEVPPQKHPFLTMIKERALSFAMIFVLGFFMLVSLLLSALIAWVSRLVAFQFPTAGLELTNTGISLLIFSALFTIIFRMLPDVDLKWSDVWPGAVFSSVLFILGKFLLGWYIGFSSNTFSRYGAAGSFIIILVWVFYSAQILFLGAEFSRAYTRKFGSHLEKKTTEAGSALPA